MSPPKAFAADSLELDELCAYKIRCGAVLSRIGALGAELTDTGHKALSSEQSSVWYRILQPKGRRDATMLYQVPVLESWHLWLLATTQNAQEENKSKADTTLNTE
jgi:hypothetical protein